MAKGEKTDNLVTVRALRDYAARGCPLIRKGMEAEISLDAAKQAMTSHPINPPIEVVSGLSAEETKEIEAYVKSYTTQWKNKKNDAPANKIR